MTRQRVLSGRVLCGFGERVCRLRKSTAKLAVAAACLFLLACAERDNTGSQTPTDSDITPNELPTATTVVESDLQNSWPTLLAARQPNFTAALRRASLRLSGAYPALEHITELSGLSPADGSAESRYAELVEELLDQRSNERLAEQLEAFWSDTFKMAGSTALFATQLALSGRSMTELFTASSGTCPIRDDDEIVERDCDNGVGRHAGLLTHPEVMSRFFSNLAFRRVRWFQEIFACREFPAETGGDAVEVGEEGKRANYVSPWPFESIAGARNEGRVDFHDTESGVCAHCHATMNHQAPLFAFFDEDGTLRESVQVTLPSGETARRSDWLPSGEGTAWRFGAPAEDLVAFGAAMAADREVWSCVVSRVWNWALGRPDMVTHLTAVPSEVIGNTVDEFIAHDHDFMRLLRQVFAAEDMVLF